LLYSDIGEPYKKDNNNFLNIESVE
jgi:hypothetical protein